MKRRKLFCLLLAAVMLFSLAACGKGEDETKDPNLLTVGEFELHYKGASIMKDREGNDALVLTLDFTNNSEETTDYFWAIYETVMQNDTELETAVVYLNEETLEAVDDSQYQNVAPGATFEVQTAYELIDTAGEVEVTFEEMEGDKMGFKEVIGSWKIMERSHFRGIFSISRSESFTRSFPLYKICPPVTLPGGFGISCIMAREDTLFPLPLSPTMPSFSPRWSV